MSRVSLKVTGAQGQGVNSVGEMCAKGLKRAGYCVFGYREYMSLIKGGHSSYQLDISSAPIQSTETMIDVLVCFNHHGLEQNWHEVKEGGVILHQTPQWKFPTKDDAALKKRKITVLYLPSEDILKRLKAKPMLGNVLITSVVWSLLSRKAEELKALVEEQFGHKGKEVLEKNYTCIDEGFRFFAEMANGKLEMGNGGVRLPKPNAQWKDHLLLTGSEAMGLGIVHAGCRVYAGYPMTPSSPLLSFVADLQNVTGMVMKQAEDEITAAQFISGATFMGARAITATSGGGFDLMSETVSLNGIIENPAVFVLAQRPGPATGLPTWTAQGDLLLAVGASHGEFARCVMAVSDAQDCFDLMPEAFNIAEKFQTPVIVLTDKQIAEALYTQPIYDLKNATLDRGLFVTDPKKLAKLKGTDRYDPNAKDGISPRWLPGALAETFCAQGDEHSADGTVDETAENAKAQTEKRMKKLGAMKRAMPEPVLYEVTSHESRVTSANPELDVLLVGWGSSKGPILDALSSLSGLPSTTLRTGSAQSSKLSIGYLHFTYLWPLRTERFAALAAKAKRIVLVEGNLQGQLGMLLCQESGISIEEKILKYDGRPFFVDELSDAFRTLFAARRQPRAAAHA